ncbi:TPA: hypothetical protein N0F65_008105 [Lagenidium giganteum]|uniref:PX domain-containing protein n=1 Tax=Lagenidium giganteum TaxID=4803 RepID=A0AAV2Z0V8_9STRA|nr:TPA: hypothetical protein N0F65_008105 [Lagenidium giganteum]
MSHQQQVDPTILKKLSASVSHFHGPRKNLSYVLSVDPVVAGRRAARKDRDSCQFVTRSMNDFRNFRKSLLTRVGTYGDNKNPSAGRCKCDGVRGCPFDVTRTFLERLRFSRMPFFGIGISDNDINNRQLEMNNFLRIIFAILHRMHSNAWNSDCLFLQDVMNFLEVEQTFSDQIQEFLKHKGRQMNLEGWKAHTIETFGYGIRTQ